jgi:2-haloacid dehalogenase
MDFRTFDVLTFDCYGTLIDWESGITMALRAVLDPRGVRAADDELLEAYAQDEAAAEAGAYLRYRDILARCLRGVCEGYGVVPTEDEVAGFAGSVGAWPAFPDRKMTCGRARGTACVIGCVSLSWLLRRRG